MAERPLLFFPTPAGVERSKPTAIDKRVLRRPGAGRQKDRIGGRFDALQAALDAGRVALKKDPSAIEPEYTLVFVLRQGISEESFQVVMRYFQKIDGGTSELLFDEDLEDVDPTDDFYFEGKPDKQLSRKFYCVLSSAKALGELLRLWECYMQEEDCKFPHGASQFKEIFPSLEDIHRWGREERFEETGLRDVWEGDLIATGIETVECNIELFFRGSEKARNEKVALVKAVLENIHAKIEDEVLIEEIAYHNFLVTIPAEKARQALAGELSDLLDCEPIMRMAPVGQVVERDYADEFRQRVAAQYLPTPDEHPVVALLDGVPQANHPLLGQYLVVDDPDELAKTSEVQTRQHGTEMASLIVYGDLSSRFEPVARKIYVRPILEAKYYAPGSYGEAAPKGVDFVSLVKGSVERIFKETEYGETIRVINFSIGIEAAHFYGMMSPLAKLLDLLSWKYRVLFIVSAGNCLGEIELEEALDEWRARPLEERGQVVLRGMAQNRAVRRILAPAESVNALTVGSVYYDHARCSETEQLLLCSNESFPSPYTALGPGMRGAVKPEIVYPGGRVYVREHLAKRQSMLVNSHSFAPGVLAACPGASRDVTDVAAYSRGTSCSCALVSRQAQKCHDALVELFADKGRVLPRDFEALLIKTMLVHGSSWAKLGDNVAEALECEGDRKKEVGKWIGYGWPDIQSARECVKSRATCIGFGEIMPDTGLEFRLPVPIDFHSGTLGRCLTVTLASFTPMNPRSQKYRGYKVWFDIPKDKDFVGDREDAHNDVVQKGAIQHERFSTDKVSLWSEDDEIAIRVSCRKDAGRECEAVPFAIIASFELLNNDKIDVYELVRTKIADRPRPRPAIPATREKQGFKVSR